MRSPNLAKLNVGLRRMALPCLLLSACTAVGPDYHTPTPATPKNWQHATAPATLKASPMETWWQTFHDEELNRLIAEAATANLELQQALVRVKDVRAQRSAIYAAALPTLSARNNISRRLNNTSGGGAQGSTAGSGFGVGSQLIDIFQLGFDAAWEIDFLGGVRRAAEAADATVDSEVENSRAVLVTLLAEVARTYLDLRAQQTLLATTQATLTNQAQTLALTQIRQQSGLTDNLASMAAEAQLATTQAELPRIESLIQQDIHALSVLLGKPPAALSARLSRPTALPDSTATIIPDLPSTLLQRRPDIRRAERLLAAATANIGVAESALYPKLNLTAFIGLQNLSVKEVTPIGKSWSTAASLTMPIFNWGRLRADVNSKKALTEGAKLAYETAVLTAFKEVEDALIAHQKARQRYQALQKAASANQQAVALASERYQKGLTTFIEVLTYQQNWFNNQQNLTQANLDVAQQLVALYKALGGGWQPATGVNDCGDCKKTWPERIHDQTKALLLIAPKVRAP